MTYTQAPAPVLKGSHIYKSFTHRGQDLEVMRDVNFEIYPGEFVALIGPSGCGKTTLLRMAHGLDRPSSGEFVVHESLKSAGKVSGGFVFQDDRLFPWKSLLANIAAGLRFEGVSRRAAMKLAEEYLELVGLAGFGRHYPHEVSGGMRKRVNIARALATQPSILYMDEPFASLDAQTRELMQRELLRIWARTEGGSVLFVTHQIDEAIFLADRVLVLAGRPARVKEVVDVGFVRPRELSLKRDARFSELYDHIWGLIEEEAEAAFYASTGAATNKSIPIEESTEVEA